MFPIKTKITTAINVEDELNSIEDMPVSAFIKELSIKWTNGEFTGTDIRVTGYIKPYRKLLYFLINVVFCGKLQIQ